MSGISDDGQWECYLCGHEFNYEQPAFGWIGNYHMLCNYCADSVYSNPKSEYHHALTYHHKAGDISVDTEYLTEQQN